MRHGRTRTIDPGTAIDSVIKPTVMIKPRVLTCAAAGTLLANLSQDGEEWGLSFCQKARSLGHGGIQVTETTEIGRDREIGPQARSFQ
jgi:hypothetical protein